MSTRKPRTPTGTAVAFGAAVFAALMIGVGGYQVSVAYAVGTVTVIPGVDESPDPYRSAASPAGSPLAMCPGWSAQDADGEFSSTSTRSTRSSLGVVSVCD